jgi:hypothetical protein
MDYADKLLLKTRNDINFKNEYTRKMSCPNRWPLGNPEDWNDPSRYENKKDRKYTQCPSGEEGKVEMMVYEDGIWTTIQCPVCEYSESWSIGDGDELF